MCFQYLYLCIIPRISLNFFFQNYIFEFFYFNTIYLGICNTIPVYLLNHSLVLHSPESHSVVSNSLQPHGLQPTRLLCSWRFSRPEYWGGLPFLSPGDLPNPGMEPRSLALQADSLPSEPPGKALLKDTQVTDTVFHYQQKCCKEHTSLRISLWHICEIFLKPRPFEGKLLG